MNMELSALVILILSSLILVLMIAFKADSKHCHWLTGFALLAAFYCQSVAFTSPTITISLLEFSSLNLVLCQLALIIVFIIYWPLQQWLTTNTESSGQFYLLLHWCTIGAFVMILANHFTVFFIGLELLSLSLIGLIAYQCADQKEREQAIEAAIKYLILSAIGSAVILLGFALVYIDSGSLDLNNLRADTASSTLPYWLLNGAILFILAGMFFKLSLAPCHLWVADLLQGAPTPAAGLLSTLSKLAIFAVLFKLFLFNGWLKIAVIEQVVSLVAIISMLWGNILALRQQNIYRLLAYSSIAHFGYLLIILTLSNNSEIVSHEVLIIYLFAYLITLSALFSILTQLGESDTLSKLCGLLWRQPLAAISIMLMVLSLAGIPLTFGFVAKFYLVLSGVENQAWDLLGALIAGSIIGMFYYFNLLITLSKPSEGNLGSGELTITRPNALANTTAVFSIIAFGIYPEPITRAIMYIVNG